MTDSIAYPDATDVAAEMADMRREVARLRAEVAALQASAQANTQAHGHTREHSTAQVEPHLSAPAETEREPGRRNWSRRAMILGGAAATVGAVNALRVASPAAASTGAMQYGAINNSEDSSTMLSSYNPNITLWVANSAAAGANGYPIGLFASSVNSTALWATSSLGVGIRAHSVSGAPIQIDPGRNAVPSSGTWATGSVVMTTSGELWFCAMGGSPGQWRLLTSLAAAGAYVPITPARVYDSRTPQPSGGALLLAGTDRVISVRDARDLNTGGVVTANIVPAGSKAITVNVTITETTGVGYIALVPGVTPTFNASSINWDRAGQTLANGLTLPIDAARNLRAFCRNGNTHLIIDVTGYFRAA